METKKINVQNKTRLKAMQYILLNMGYGRKTPKWMQFYWRYRDQFLVLYCLSLLLLTQKKNRNISVKFTGKMQIKSDREKK